MQRFERIALTTPNGILCVDGMGKVTAINPAAAQIFGYSEDQIVERRLDVLMPAWRASKIALRLAQRFTDEGTGSAIEEDIVGRHANGENFPIEVAWTVWMEDDQPNLGLVIRDLREERRQQDDLYRLANFDQVTTLPNLNHFRERVAQELPATILSLGLSEYHDLSDTLGLKAGEELLLQIAERLRQCVRTIDMVARTASNEFGICLSGVGDPIRAKDAATAAMAAIAQPFVVDGSELRLQAHCGISLCPSHGSDAAELIGNAHMALQEARKQGAGEVFLYVPALRMQAVARRMFDAELHQAVERGELQLYFQPQVRLSDGALTGAEALLRWNHPVRGVLAPAAFLSALETSPLAVVVGNWIIDTACRNAAQWRDEGCKNCIGSLFRESVGGQSSCRDALASQPHSQGHYFCEGVRSRWGNIFSNYLLVSICW